ncbi:MAG: Rrf2 family transcriptional regulator [Planctomycetaceae bacterium]|nr:Rrf2 family transcriptional regulator [Planctomycetaceae bacterium]
MLPKTAEYALRTIAFLASDVSQAAAADVIAKKTQVPRRYLHKVLQDLVRAELVSSRSGPGGGYSLACGADEVTILDVVNAVAPLERIRHCPLGLASHTSLCPLHQELDRAYEATETAFSRVTIGELLRSTSSVIPLCDVSLLPGDATSPEST